MGQRIALTFDTEHPDHPHDAGGEGRLLELLSRTGVRATFFLQGRWVQAYRPLARSIATAGHRVANHGHYHVRMPLLTEEGFAADVRASDLAIREHTGADPRPWFRFPFGNGADDPAMHERLDRLGYRHVGWDVNVEEWQLGATVAQVADGLESELLEAPDAAIVLMHGWPAPVSGALAALIPRMQARGAEFVTIDDLGADVRATIPAWVPRPQRPSSPSPTARDVAGPTNEAAPAVG